MMVLERAIVITYQIDGDEEGEQSHNVFVSEDDLLVLRRLWLLRCGSPPPNIESPWCRHWPLEVTVNRWSISAASQSNQMPSRNWKSSCKCLQVIRIFTWKYEACTETMGATRSAKSLQLPRFFVSTWNADMLLRFWLNQRWFSYLGSWVASVFFCFFFVWLVLGWVVFSYLVLWKHADGRT